MHHRSNQRNVLFFTFFAIFMFFHLAQSGFMRKKYVIEIENVELCPNNDRLEMPYRNLKFSRSNRTHRFLSFDITYTRPIDESIGGSITVERWGGSGGWISIPFLPYQHNICGYVSKYFPGPWVKWHRAMGVKNPDKCPIPKANYSMRNFVYDHSEIAISFWSGRFRFTTNYKETKSMKVLMCLIDVLSITEVYDD